MDYLQTVMLNGTAPPCHPERNGATPVILNGTEWSEGSVTDSSLTLRMTDERSVIDDVASSVCERMTCIGNSIGNM